MFQQISGLSTHFGKHSNGNWITNSDAGNQHLTSPEIPLPARLCADVDSSYCLGAICRTIHLVRIIFRLTLPPADSAASTREMQARSNCTNQLRQNARTVRGRRVRVWRRSVFRLSFYCYFYPRFYCCFKGLFRKTTDLGKNSFTLLAKCLAIPMLSQCVYWIFLIGYCLSDD